MMNSKEKSSSSELIRYNPKTKKYTLLQSGRTPEAISDFCGNPLKQVLSVRKKLQMENGDE